MSRRRPNTTQRSWSNYEGDNPKKDWVGQGPQGEARFYSDSSKYGPGASYVPPVRNDEEEIPEGFEKDPTTGEFRRVSLKKRMEEKQRQSALERGMSQMRKGRIVEGTYNEDVYTS